MSFEYTIDIQLTELGFPVIQQTAGETLNPSASSEDSFSPSHKQKLISDEKEAAKQTSVVSSSLSDTGPGKQSHPPEPDEAVEAAELSEATGNAPTAGLETTDTALLTAELEKDAAEESTQDVDYDSDDSEVSGVYEEEDLDEEEEDDVKEDGKIVDSGQSRDYRCSVCDLQLPSKFKLQDHMNLHTGARPYCCAECGKRFSQVYNYRVHLRTHAQTKVDRLLCRVCLMGFASQEDLKNHLAQTHLEDKFYECDLCKRVFTSLKACEYHVQLHKCMQSVVCQICGRNFSSPQALARHRKKTCHHNFKCTDCTMTFTKKNALLKHSFSHLGLLPYTCIRCHCHFRLAKLYRQHKCKPESIHCVACLREFLSQEDFQQHKKDTGCWGNQEPNKTMDEIRCLECGQKFDTSEELKKHAGAHQRVLKCAECGKGFRSALLLMSHMGGHAGQSPCLCQSCGLGFPHQQNYDSHLKTCGQTPQPVSAPKKRQTTKSSLPETNKHNEKPDSLNIANTNKVSATLNDSRCPESVTISMSAGSAPSDGLWKLTLDKQPPPGVKLVLLLPVCPTQANGVPIPPAVQQTLPVPPVHAVSGVAAVPAAGNGNIRVNAAIGVQMNAPLDLSNGIQEDSPAPLDLSKKCNTFKSATADVPLIAVKSEPEELEISGQADHAASSALLMDFKKESLDSSTSTQLTDTSPKTDIKMEVDI